MKKAELPNGKDLIISTPGYMAFEEGSECTFGFEADAVHFFNADTGERINR